MVGGSPSVACALPWDPQTSCAQDQVGQPCRIKQKPLEDKGSTGLCLLLLPWTYVNIHQRSLTLEDMFYDIQLTSGEEAAPWTQERGSLPALGNPHPLKKLTLLCLLSTWVTYLSIKACDWCFWWWRCICTGLGWHLLRCLSSWQLTNYWRIWLSGFEARIAILYILYILTITLPFNKSSLSYLTFTWHFSISSSVLKYFWWNLYCLVCAFHKYLPETVNSFSCYKIVVKKKVLHSGCKSKQ